MMDYVAPMVNELNIHTERRLQRQLDNRELELNREYLKEFEKVSTESLCFIEIV